MVDVQDRDVDLTNFSKQIEGYLKENKISGVTAASFDGWEHPIMPVDDGKLSVDVDGVPHSVWAQKSGDGSFTYLLLDQEQAQAAQQAFSDPVLGAHEKVPYVLKEEASWFNKETRKFENSIKAEEALINPVTHEVLDPKKYSMAHSVDKKTGEVIHSKDIKFDDFDKYRPVHLEMVRAGATEDGKISQSEILDRNVYEFKHERIVLPKYVQAQEIKAAVESSAKPEHVTGLSLKRSDVDADASVSVYVAPEPPEVKDGVDDAPPPKPEPKQDEAKDVKPKVVPPVDPSKVPPIKDDFKDAAKDAPVPEPVLNNDISGFGVLLPDSMPEDVLKAEALAAKVAEKALNHMKYKYLEPGRVPDDQRLNSDQVDQVIKQFDKDFPHYAAKLRGAHEALEAGEDVGAVEGRVIREIRATRTEHYRAKRDEIKYAGRELKAREGLKDDLEELWGKDDPRIDAIVHAAEHPEDAAEVLGAKLNTDMMGTFRQGPGGDALQSIKMDDGKTYVLWQRERGGDSDYVLRTPAELRSDMSKVYRKTVQDAGFDYKLSENARKSAESLAERHKGDDDKEVLAVVKGAQDFYESTKPDNAGLLGLNALKEHVQGAADKVSTGTPDFDMSGDDANLGELPPAMRAAVLRHNGSEEAAETLETSMAKSVEQSLESAQPPVLGGVGG